MRSNFAGFAIAVAGLIAIPADAHGADPMSAPWVSSLSISSFRNLTGTREGGTDQDFGAQLDKQIAALGSVVMHEEIFRYASAGDSVRKVDQFDADVEMVDGIEKYTMLRRNGQPFPEAQIQGAWSIGDFSSLLRISREALIETAHPFASNPLNPDLPVLATSFDCLAASKRWFVSVNSRLYWLDFRAEVLLSPLTGNALSIVWTAEHLAPETGIKQIQRTVRFAPMNIGGEAYVLPATAEYRVSYRSRRVEWNVARFSAAARYGSQTSVSYEE